MRRAVLLAALIALLALAPTSWSQLERSAPEATTIPVPIIIAAAPLAMVWTVYTYAADPNVGYWQLPMAPRWYTAPDFCEYVTNYDGHIGVAGYHTGEDVPKVHGTPVCAAADGIVRLAGDDDMRQDHGYGHVIVIEHNDPRHYPSPRCSLYGHLSHDGMYVRKGQLVKKGQVIGHVGTAREGHILVGPHLHFHIYKGTYSAYAADLFASTGPTAQWVKDRFENPATDLINRQGFIDKY
jgi:murein DD-endopeptidase MepM/ murein hydrolase activator NlpD